MSDNFGSTKFWFAVLSSLLGFGLAITNKITGSDFMSFLSIIGATYVAGNVASKFAPTVTPTTTVLAKSTQDTVLQ